MEASEQSVLEQLVSLEKEGQQRAAREDAERCQVLRITILTLRSRRERLQQQLLAVQMLKDKLHHGLMLEDGEAELQKSSLEAWLLQLKDLRRGHLLIGGYDLQEREDGKIRLLRFHTAFQGVYQDTYTLELTPSLKISRHNLPPYFPLESLTAHALQKDLKACLESLSRSLNALVGRRRQLALVRELVGCVEVMESNQLCNTLVLMCRSGGEKLTAVLCSLEYRELGRSLPTHVTIQSTADELLPESGEWRKNRLLLLESPLHHALLTMKKTGSIS